MVAMTSTIGTSHVVLTVAEDPHGVRATGAATAAVFVENRTVGRAEQKSQWAILRKSIEPTAVLYRCRALCRSARAR